VRHIYHEHVMAGQSTSAGIRHRDAVQRSYAFNDHYTGLVFRCAEIASLVEDMCQACYGEWRAGMLQVEDLEAMSTWQCGFVFGDEGARGWGQAKAGSGVGGGQRGTPSKDAPQLGCSREPCGGTTWHDDIRPWSLAMPANQGRPHLTLSRIEEII
jgi:hypothetical protein